MRAAAELLERLGRPSEAATHWRRVARLWADADPALEPEAARARLALPDLVLPPLRLREEAEDTFRLMIAGGRPGLAEVTLGLLRAAGIRPAQLTPIRPERLPMLLSLPSPIFRRLARRMVEIDPLAR